MSVSQDGVGNVRIVLARHSIREPAVLEVGRVSSRLKTLTKACISDGEIML